MALPMDTCGDTLPPGTHMDRVAATMPSQAHAGAAQEAPDIGQWEGQNVRLVRPSSCFVKGGIPSSRRNLPIYLPAMEEGDANLMGSCLIVCSRLKPASWSRNS